MTDTLALALAQINPTVGDLGGNAERIVAARDEAARSDADLVVFGELAVSGYPPEDLVLKTAFQDGVGATVRALAEVTRTGGPGLLLGAPWRVDGRLYNAALLLADGEVVHVRLKHELPNYGVFDEKRVFAVGPAPEPMPYRGVRLGVMVCEDMWFPDVADHLSEAGAELLVVINGSPFDAEKSGLRLERAAARVAETGLPLVYVNLVGGQDELVFDGHSFVLGADRSYRARAHSWEEDILATEWHRNGDAWQCRQTRVAAAPEYLESVYRAMVTGLGDYVAKNGFPGVLVGLSGGIDSALTAAVAVDALGADRVLTVMMPSPYTSDESLQDAEETARRLGCRIDTISIEPAMGAFERMLADALRGREPDATEENVQARARAIILMALSNKLGHMVLSTGNKSEMSVGYATLYGDMCGGYSVLKDVYKTTVYGLTRWRNRGRPAGLAGPPGPVIAERILTKAPSAELKPDQTDQDTLPPYDVLDGILQGLVEEEWSVAEIVERGYDRGTVERVWRMLDRAEYKRRQAPPGVKITDRAFGRDRRYPITNRFRGEG